MKPVTRWALLVGVVVAIALLFVLWNQRDRQQAPTDSAVAEPPAVPMPPQEDGPVKASVHFDFDRSVLRSGEIPKLDELLARFQGRSFVRVDAVGYADRIGPDPYNLRLSGQRAESVRAYLVGKGLAAGSIHTEAKGESDSLSGDACKKTGTGENLVECLQPDRRVEITLVAGR